ncbi:unnamed protein product [Paramecium sonneborni]|uniref:Uncharacterized protein n=1 Tax=Paramecium sonneborni TaxID=65129 RepID=A0A8S1M9B2_9CILI|nr:unnamed protein product [Paramecium sonneborni]
MKYVILALVLAIAVGTSSEENVLQLLAELKHNAELELEGLELAWQRRIGEKQSVADSLNQSVLNQRAECQNKENDIAQKQSDILASESFINWMTGRQKSNTKKIGVLEASICALTNNYVNDIRNFRYALALVKFLREELTKLEGGASLAQVTEFHDRVSKFVKLYRSGQLVNLMEKIDDKSDLIVPEIEQGTFDEISLIQRIRPKALTQLDQVNDDDDKANNAVVLIPGCDDQIGTVVVVQNDDGTSDSGDLNVKITNGGGVSTTPSGGKSGSTSKPTHKDTTPKKEETNDVEDVDDTDDDVDDVDDVDDTDDDVDDGEDVEDDGEDVEDVNDDVDDTEDVDVDDDNDDGDDVDDGEDTEDDDNHPEIIIDDQQPDHHVDEEPHFVITPDGPHPTGAIIPPGEEEFPNDWQGFRKLLDAIENHTRRSLETGANDEVRSNLGFIDFKLHVELENQFFDKTIQYEKEYLVKQVNQLTTRRQASILCGARLKQITVAHQVALKDIDAAKQFYEEQRKLKQEEVNTFDDVYRIYTTQVNH